MNLDMELVPSKLTIPLDGENYAWGWLIVLCVAIATLLSWMSSDLALLFIAASILVLPVLLPLLMCQGLSSWFLSRVGRTGAILMFFAYFGLAKFVLIQFLAQSLEALFL